MTNPNMIAISFSILKCILLFNALAVASVLIHSKLSIIPAISPEHLKQKITLLTKLTFPRE